VSWSSVRHGPAGASPTLEAFARRALQLRGRAGAPAARTHAGIGLIVRALAAFVQGTEDDDLLDSCLYLPRP